jgi:hypothetical protein
VHLVLGNHEVMVLRGDLRYLNPKYAETTRVLALTRYSELFAGDSLLGQWLRSKPAVFRLNDSLCLHGGISRALLDSGLTLGQINGSIRALISDRAPASEQQMQRAELLLGPQGPLWYRGYFPEFNDFATATTEDVDRTLAQFGAKRIFVGHTMVRQVTPLYEGRVIAVQVYPRRGDDGAVSFEGVLVRDGGLWRATPTGLEPLASAGPAAAD